jgi:Mg/Co/Ni transporter MgtE
MAPDAATDLLAELPEKKANAVLAEMGEERAADVRQLMRYPDHTAGREMTTDFVCVRPAMTVGDVIESNKPRFLTADLIYYMYVTASDGDDTLVGVITVRDLLLQSRETPVSDFMLTDFLAVRPGEHEREVARKMAEYNLLALPVVDRNNALLGVITIDDALDSLLPEGWKKRLPRIFS